MKKYSVVLSLLSLAFLVAGREHGQQEPDKISNAVVNEPIQFDVSPPLRDLSPEVSSTGGGRLILPPLEPKPNKRKQAAPQQGAPVPGGLTPTSPSSLIRATIGLNFDGVGQNATNNCPNISG